MLKLGRAIEADEREKILTLLRQAVVYQIGLWDTALEIAEQTECEYSDVLKWVNETSITADSGLELTGRDLDEFLGLAIPTVKIGRPLPDGPEPVQ
jgi:hypothetical protein